MRLEMAEGQDKENEYTCRLSAFQLASTYFTPDPFLQLG
jgi:hypothetical protein